MKNPINPFTENIIVEGKRIGVVHIPEGFDKPYFDNNGMVWVKSGSDKRMVTSRVELRRLCQSADLGHADEISVNGACNDILTSFATKILPYWGIGTGVRRALNNYPEIELVNDTENNQFKVGCDLEICIEDEIGTFNYLWLKKYII